MSVKITSLIWDNGDEWLAGSRLNIMLCLADHSNDDGICWPSIQRLAARSRLSIREVAYILRDLKTRGYLSVVQRPGSSNIYRVVATPATGCIPPSATDCRI